MTNTVLPAKPPSDLRSHRRAISRHHSLKWRPSRGVNLILGGGDVGKTAILEAIALLLSPLNGFAGQSEPAFSALTSSHTDGTSTKNGNHTSSIKSVRLAFLPMPSTKIRSDRKNSELNPCCEK